MVHTLIQADRMTGYRRGWDAGVLSDSGDKRPIPVCSANNGQGYFAGSVLRSADGRTPWNKDSHQLVAAGFDNDLGFLPYARLKHLPNKLQYAKFNIWPTLEADNVTNFKQGVTLGD